MVDETFPKSGSDLLLEVLQEQGITHVFGNPGTTEMPIMHSLRQDPDIQYVLGLQETSVVAMADGYAKAKGKPAFVNLHTAGGLGHAMGAMLHAHIARTPMLVTAGQQDTRHSFTDPLLYGDIQRMADPTVKWSREVIHPEHIPALVRRGLQEAMIPPRGPVMLSLPIDVLTRTTKAKAGRGSTIYAKAAADGLEVLAAALAAIGPRRLAIVAGDEIDASHAGSELIELVEILGVKVFGPSWPGSMPFPTDHPLWAGNLPSTASAMQKILSDYDAVLVLGANPFISYLYSEGDAVPADCRIFQLTEDASQAGRIFPAQIACVGHLKTSLARLIPLMTPLVQKHKKEVEALFDLAKASRRHRLEALVTRFDTEHFRRPITPFVATGEILNAIGKDAAVVDEAPATMYHVRAFLERASVRRYFFMRSAILGWGLPAAVGVSLGLDRSPVVALLGDGSALYSPQALWSAGKLELPVTFVIMNNAEYNILKRYSVAQGYERQGNSTIAGMELVDPAIDFTSLASAFGIQARRASHADEIGPMIKNAIASGRPNLVEIAIGTE
ncbi:thiamine pyrophosphate-binding protein [Oryzifoliimicrobium ureilyticus]|uniref:thiamine pyrophosphate-binding protein n=1 Tax=Oryzifoliimicrobium ureilyticus TaxID=3113724 RepID=UPI00307676FB